MSAEIISGKELSAKIRGELKMKVEEIKAAKGITPGLAVITSGE
jgi:methylenetetrahydrofolate dehydrogenase (NADP+)/methenyltetrahydrofolate cyclohydrolase